MLRSAKVMASSPASLAPARAVLAWVSAVLTACWAAAMKLSKASLAWATLFSANCRISAGISKLPSFVITASLYAPPVLGGLGVS